MYEISIYERQNKDEVGVELLPLIESEVFLLGFQRPDRNSSQIIIGINGRSPREIAGLFTTILKKMDEFCENHPAVGDLYNAYKLQKFTDQLESFFEDKEQPREE